MPKTLSLHVIRSTTISTDNIMTNMTTAFVIRSTTHKTDDTMIRRATGTIDMEVQQNCANWYIPPSNKPACLPACLPAFQIAQQFLEFEMPCLSDEDIRDMKGKEADNAGTPMDQRRQLLADARQVFAVEGERRDLFAAADRGLVKLLKLEARQPPGSSERFCAYPRLSVTCWVSVPLCLHSVFCDLLGIRFLVAAANCPSVYAAGCPPFLPPISTRTQTLVSPSAHADTILSRTNALASSFNPPKASRLTEEPPRCYRLAARGTTLTLSPRSKKSRSSFTRPTADMQRRGRAW